MNSQFWLISVLVLEGDVVEGLLTPVRPEPVLQDGQPFSAIRQHPHCTSDRESYSARECG
jgi:hypothetical protein